MILQLPLAMSAVSHLNGSRDSRHSLRPKQLQPCLKRFTYLQRPHIFNGIIFLQLSNTFLFLMSQCQLEDYLKLSKTLRTHIMSRHTTIPNQSYSLLLAKTFPPMTDASPSPSPRLSEQNLIAPTNQHSIRLLLCVVMAHLHESITRFQQAASPCIWDIWAVSCKFPTYDCYSCSFQIYRCDYFGEAMRTLPVRKAEQKPGSDELGLAVLAIRCSFFIILNEVFFFNKIEENVLVK